MRQRASPAPLPGPFTARALHPPSDTPPYPARPAKTAAWPLHPPSGATIAPHDRPRPPIRPFRPTRLRLRPRQPPAPPSAVRRDNCPTRPSETANPALPLPDVPSHSPPGTTARNSRPDATIRDSRLARPRETAYPAKPPPHPTQPPAPPSDRPRQPPGKTTTRHLRRPPLRGPTGTTSAAPSSGPPHRKHGTERKGCSRVVESTRNQNACTSKPQNGQAPTIKNIINNAHFHIKIFANVGVFI